MMVTLKSPTLSYPPEKEIYMLILVLYGNIDLGKIEYILSTWKQTCENAREHVQWAQPLDQNEPC